ncbi:protein kinase domain-containing protein [Streptomyces venezuelae]|uniref:protein kinase domain-containing protein n=1 Tax=Streptomyces venezuelae TaxID=54571 RepID=UPI00168018BC|nr:protein kinase [Streptomyces venezuelae]
MTTVPPTEVDPEGFGEDFNPGPEETRRGLDRVPASLSARLDLTEVLSDVQRPTQAVVLRVKDREARHRDPAVPLVLKWYHRAFAPDPDARRLLTGDLGAHVVRVLEHGIADGHPYELLPSYGETTLADYHARHPGPLPAPLVHTVVAHLHEALSAAHGLAVVHRDVTPDNIVVRTQNEDRLDLVLVDFGAAVHLGRDEESPRRRDWKGKPLYLAPEASTHRQSVTPAADWWSAGMVVAELAGGRHPVDFRGDEEVLAEIATHDPELPLVTDPRVLMLCHGLLTRAPEHRWGAEQVGRWLAGDSPPVAPRTTGAAPEDLPPRSTAEPFAFLGRAVTSTEELARQFDLQWRAAEDLLADRRGRARLVAWLGRFADAPDRSPEDTEELNALLSLLGQPPDPPTTLRLLNWMGPRLTASWRGVPLDTLGIADLERDAVRGDDRSRDLVAALARHELLPLLAARPGGEGLDEVQRRWQDYRQSWREATADLFARGGPRERRSADRLLHRTRDLDARLLLLAREPDRTAARLLRGTAWDRSRGDTPPHWYRALRADPDNPLRLLAASLLIGLARLEAQQHQDELRDRELDRLFAEETDARFEVLRRLDRPPALGWALLGATVATAPWTFVIGLADLLGRAGQREVVLAWMLALPAAAAVFALELWIAVYIGPHTYHPARSLVGLVIRTGDRPARAARSGGRLGMAVAAAALAAVGVLGVWAVTWAPWAWPAGTVVALTAWTVQRWWAWRRHSRDARQARAAHRAGRATASVPHPAPAHRPTGPTGPTGMAGPHDPTGPAGPAGAARPGSPHRRPGTPHPAAPTRRNT